MMRELTRKEVDELLGEQVVGRIGCHADGLTYVVPVIYALADDCVCVASVEGQKIRMMRQNPQVCFEVDEYDGKGSWQSAIVQGVFEELEGADAAKAIGLLAGRFGRAAEEGRAGRPRDAGGPAMVCFRIRLRAASGRAVSR